ncbi:crotonase/enoyl-CoA hydratase family protein [Dokdonella ginsengisoli]|uniref:Crotonase/enoyl-CoA hydratase family protein n=1 Tax=Dokdonella ginsengisoli TaxID=363846 RepID=A0ABV9QUH3_9GAMM
MTAVEILRRNNDYRLLRTIEDPVANTYWCFMHANRVPNSGYRACFSPQLIKEIREFQKSVSDRLTLCAANADTRLANIVLASDADVFNHGGDLDLFCRLIRARNREHLLAYARQCVEGVYGFHAHLNRNAYSIALVQGDALGGGFEAALSCQTIIAESGVGMGLPEVLFDLFPGMGAYSFLCQRVSPKLAEEMMLNGTVYSTDELYKLGVVDVLVPRGEGVAAVNEHVRRAARIPHARSAMNRVREICRPISLNELMQVTEVWVDTAIQLGDKSLRTMERLVRAQEKRPTTSQPDATRAVPSFAATAQSAAV